MKTLREDLHALAEQAPAVDLADRAVRGARRRGAARLAVAAVAAVCAIGGGGTVILQQVNARPPIVLTPPETTVPPLPAKGVGPVEQLYRPRCEDCDVRVWRLVTRGGDTYELAGGPENGPVEATADGRRIAYYSPALRTIVVRDLATGEVWKSPLEQPEQDFAVEYALRLSPGGLRFVVSGWGGRKQPNKLVDVERGTVTDLKKGWWPVSVADGTGPVVLAKPFDEVTRLWVLGRDPVTIEEFTYEFSALAPDGHTIARVGTTYDRDRRPMVERDGTIVVSDVMGGAERRIPVSGIADGLLPARLGGWPSAGEVTLLATPREPDRPAMVYAVDVTTGRARELFPLRDDGQFVVPGLVR